MENFRLKVFRTVAEKHSFRHAADALHLSQPAVSLQIKALEDEIGLRLIDRRRKPIALTEAGARLLTYVKHIATVVQAANQEMAHLKYLDQTELKVCAPTPIAFPDRT